MCTLESSEGKWKSGGAYNTFYIQNAKLWGYDKTKGFGLGAVNCDSD